MRKVGLQTWLIARTVLIEAIRRREIYAIVLSAVALIGVAGCVRFFQIEGLGKFYREIALHVMNMATALTVVILASRQLPREFEKRTIYPLLAKPVGRFSFLLGKFLGVLLAGAFCYSMFLVVFLVGSLYLRAHMGWTLLLQGVYLQALALAVIASVSFLLSLWVHLDAAITIASLLYFLGQILTSTLSYIYDSVTAGAQLVLLVLNFGIPQLTLFDLSGKIVHCDAWSAIPLWAVGSLTLYAGLYTSIFLGGSYLLFRRRAI